MIGFFLKKTFFDGWDNFITLLITNVASVLLLALGYGVLQLIAVDIFLTLAALIIWLAAAHIFIGAVSFYTKEFAFYQRPDAEEFLKVLKASLRYSLLLAALSTFLLVTAFLVIPFYFRLGNFLGTAIGALLIWIVLISAVSLSYFLPVGAQLGDRPLKALKKAFIIAVDNPLFSIFLALYTLAAGILSVATAFLIPGPAGILLAHQDAVKLIMYKYDYLEEQGASERMKIPWYALLIEEREAVGSRTIKGMIFPWKE